MLNWSIDGYLVKDKVEKCLLELDAAWGLTSEKNGEVITTKCRDEVII